MALEKLRSTVNEFVVALESVIVLRRLRNCCDIITIIIIINH